MSQPQVTTRYWSLGQMIRRQGYGSLRLENGFERLMVTTDVVMSVCLTSDGSRLFTGSHDNTAKLWNVETGECVRTFTGHTNWVMSVCLTSDDKRLLTGSNDDTGKLWSVETGECVRTFEGHTNGVLSVCLTSDDRRLVTGSRDETAMLWGAAR